MFWSREEWEAFVRREMQPDGLRLRRSIKTVVACLICTLIGLAYQFPLYHWMLVTVFALTMPNIGATVEKAWLRFGGTLVGAGVGVGLTVAFAQHPLFYLVGLTLFFGACFYYGVGKFYPYVFMLAAITAVLVAVGTLQEPTGVVAYAASRVLDIGVGIAVSLAVTVLLWPEYAHRDLRTSLGRVAKGCADLLREVNRALLQGEVIGVAHRDREARISREFARQVSLVNQAAIEDIDVREASPELTAVILELESLFAKTVAARRAVQEGIPNGLQQWMTAELEQLTELIARRLDELSDLLAAGETESWRGDEGLPEAYAAALARLESLRAEGRSYQVSLVGNLKFDSYILALSQMVTTIGRIRSHVLAIAQRREHAGRVARRGFSLATEAWTYLTTFDAVRFRHAIKSAFVLLILLILTQAHVFPFPVPTLVSATVVLILTNVGATIHKSLLRLLGALAGGGLAIFCVVFVFSQAESLLPMLMVSSAIYFVFAWVNNGSPTYSYAGFQMTLAFVITIFGAFAPPDSVLPALERVVGVVIGTSVSILVITVIWPVHALTERRKILAALFKRYAERLGAFVSFRCLSEADRHQQKVLHHAVLVRTKEALDLCVEARFEGEDTPERNAEFVHLIQLTERVFFAMVALEEALDAPADPEVSSWFEATYRSLASKTEEAAGRLAVALETDFTGYRPLPRLAERAALGDLLVKLRETRATAGMAFERIGPSLTVAERLLQVDEMVGRAEASAFAAFGPQRVADLERAGWQPTRVAPLPVELT